MSRLLSVVREAIEICDVCRAEGVEVRLFGGVAASIVGSDWFARHPQHSRVPRDIDLVTAKRDLGPVRTILIRMGFAEARQVAFETEGGRAVFGNESRTIDVAGDELVFCQRLNVLPRFTLSFPTLSLTDLVLEKLQIVEPAERQFLDFVAMVASARPGDIDKYYLWQVLGRSWGFWHSAQLFMDATRTFTATAKIGDAEESIAFLERAIEETPKTYLWRIRSWFGTMFPWHAPVESLRQDERRVVVR